MPPFTVLESLSRVRYSGLMVLILVLLSALLSDATAAMRRSTVADGQVIIGSPPVIIQAGTVGNSTVYLNGTSAATQVAARGWKVQSGTGSIIAGNTYVTVDIESVNLSSSFLLMQFGGGAASNQAEQRVVVSGKFGSSSQLRFERTGTTNPANFGWYVVEALSMQVNVQSGSTGLSSLETQRDVSITDVVDVSKCVVFLSRMSTGSDRTQYNKCFVTGELTNATNLRLMREGTGTTVTAEWFVVKFNDGTAIQTGETIVSTSNPTAQDVSSVDLSRSWLYYTWRATDNGLAQVSVRGWLENSTQARLFRRTTTGTVYVRWFVIQMPSGTNAQRGFDDSTVNSEYTKDLLISSVNLSRAFSWTTCDSTGTGDNFPRPFWIERITNATNLHLERWYTGQTSDHNWQVIELPCAYDYVLQVANQVADSWKARLKAYDQTNTGRLANCTIYFHNGSGATRQIYIQDGAYIQQVGSYYDLEESNTFYIAITAYANTTETSRIYAYLEILKPSTTTYNLMIITFEVS